MHSLGKKQQYTPTEYPSFKGAWKATQLSTLLFSSTLFTGVYAHKVAASDERSRAFRPNFIYNVAFRPDFLKFKSILGNSIRFYPHCRSSPFPFRTQQISERRNENVLLEVGLYLVVETKVPENVTYTVDPFLVSLPTTDRKTLDHWFYDVTVYPKNQTGEPTLDKEVADADHGLSFQDAKEGYEDVATISDNELVNYRILSTLPQIHSTAT